MIKRVDVAVDRIDIQIRPEQLLTIVGDAFTPMPPRNDATTDEATLVLSVPARLRRAGLGMKLLADGPRPHGVAKSDTTLIKLLVWAHAFRDRLLGQGKQITGDAAMPSHVTRVARLSYLAPDIVDAILDGHQSRGLTAEKLLDHSRLPLAWRDQRDLLGFL